MNADAQVSAGGQWLACGASVTGSEHRRRGLGCDDAYSYGIFGDFLVAAVADGAGSVTGTSAWGAFVACRGILKDAMDPDFVDRYRAGSAADAQQLMRSLFERALQRVHRQAVTMGLDVMLLSTTLCVGLADRNRATFAQIGDGIVATERDNKIETLLIERKEEYANTTSFLQSERALEDSLRTASPSGVTAFALSTDGMSYKITDVATGDAYQPFFRGSWQHLRSGVEPKRFKAMLDNIEDDQTGDDKTMVLAALGEPTSGTQAETMRWAHSGPPGSGTDPKGSIPAVTVADVDDVAAGAPAAGRSWWGRWRR